MTKGCKHLCKSIHFRSHDITSCSSNAKGIVFQNAFNSFDCLNIKTMYSDLLESFKQGLFPECCRNCFEIEDNFDLSQIKEVRIKTFFISNWLHCNAYCIYCVHNCIKNKKNVITNKIQKSETYDVMPLLNTLKENNLIDKNPIVYITGGEPALLKELLQVIKFFLRENATYFMIFSSGIKYSKDIHNLLKNKNITTELLISPDAGNKNLYKKIKCTDKFSDCLHNLKKYNKGITNPQSRVIAKYICIKNINDNKENLKEFIDSMNKIGITNIRLDVEYNYPDKTSSIIPSLFKYGKMYASTLNINVDFNGIALHDLEMA